MVHVDDIAKTFKQIEWQNNKKMRLLPLLVNMFLLQVHLQIWSKREEKIEKPIQELFGQLGKEGRKTKEKRNLKSPLIATSVFEKRKTGRRRKEKGKKKEEKEEKGS